MIAIASNTLVQIAPLVSNVGTYSFYILDPKTLVTYVLTTVLQMASSNDLYDFLSLTDPFKTPQK